MISTAPCVTARRGEEYVIFSWREIVRCICTTCVFLVGNRARNGVAIVVGFKNLFTLGTCFQLFHSIRICDRSAPFLVNCLKKLSWQQRQAEFNLFAYK